MTRKKTERKKTERKRLRLQRKKKHKGRKKEKELKSKVLHRMEEGIYERVIVNQLFLSTNSVG